MYEDQLEDSWAELEKGHPLCPTHSQNFHSEAIGDIKILVSQIIVKRDRESKTKVCGEDRRGCKSTSPNPNLRPLQNFAAPASTDVRGRKRVLQFAFCLHSPGSLPTMHRHQTLSTSLEKAQHGTAPEDCEPLLERPSILLSKSGAARSTYYWKGRLS